MIGALRVIIAFCVFAAAASAQNPVTTMDIHPQWSPDGNKIVFYRVPSDFSKSTIELVDVKTGEARTLIDNGFYNANPVWHPSGAEILYSSARPNMRGDWQLYQLSLDTGEETQLTEDGMRRGHPFWRPDGSSIVFQQRVPAEDGAFKTDLFAFDVAVGIEHRLTQSDVNEFHPKFGPDSDYFFYDAGDRSKGDIFRYDLRTRQAELYIIAPKGMRVGLPAPSPDGNQLLYSVRPQEQGPGNLMLHDVHTGKSRLLTNLEGAQSAGAATWSPDGRRVAFAVMEGRRARIWLLDLGSGARRPLLDK